MGAGTLKRTAGAIIFFCVSVMAGAQETGTSALNGEVGSRRRSGVVRLLDGALDFRDRLVKNDSLYIVRPPQKVKLGFSLNCSGAEIDARGNGGRGEFRTTLSSELKATASVNVAYRGLGIGLKVNPANIFGKKSSTELDMSLYGNRIGIDAVYQSSGAYKGKIETGGASVDVPEGLVNVDMLLVNMYYAFNAGRFSYPAAFRHSWIQRRSGGSILAGLSYTLGKQVAEAEDEIGNPRMSLSTSYGSVGVGYGYNFVIRHDWLLHVSAIPQVVVYSRNRMRIGDDSERAPYRFPDIMTVGRIALVRQFPKYYVGLSGKVTSSTIGDRRRLLFSNTKWIGQITFGIKLR